MTEEVVTGAPEAPPQEAPRPQTFADMGLDPAIKQALDDMGFQVPMEVQSAVYGRAMAGTDLMVQSRTGSGKTAAFGIPIAHLISPEVKAPQVLCLTPTRELALQVAQELAKITAYRNLAVAPVYGGAPMGKQIDQLRGGAQIIAGTPGRVLDHLRRGTLKPQHIKVLVLDECDEMLSMGFQEEIEKIIAELPPKTDRQTLLFSATIPEEIERIAKRHMREYEKITLSQGYVSVHSIEHRYYLVSGLSRTRDLLRVMEYERPESAIIFCNTREDTAMTASFLQRAGYDAEAISSDLTQADRERVMGLMRGNKLRFLCATDIAARGIDISNLSHVINYTFPESPEVYIHRTGRTGRAGNSGVAVSLVGPREIGSFYYLKLLYKIKPVERELPTEGELRTRREAERYAEIAKRVTADAGEDWRALARRVWVSSDGERIVGQLLKEALERDAPPAPAPAPAPAREREPQREREARPPRADRPERRDDRPRRDRGERGDRGDRGGGRGGERGERRERRPARAEGSPPAEGAPKLDGKKEFWETWVDEKVQREGDAPTASNGDPAAQAAERRPRRERILIPDDPPGHTRLYVNVGKREGLTSEDVAKLAIEAMPDAELGPVTVLGTHTYVCVKDEQVQALCAALAGKTVGDRAVLAEPARK